MSDLKNNPDVKKIASANSEFSSNLYNSLKSEFPENLVYSPVCLSAVMAMVKIGARGKTAEEMVKTMNFPEDDRTLTNGYSKLLDSVKTTNEGYTLAAANRLYPAVDFCINEEFSKEVQKNFKAEIEKLDFNKNVESAKTINDWVETNTQGKIKDLIKSDKLDGLTQIVLVNAIYFKGLWQNQFLEADTKNTTFYLNATEEVHDVPMMYKMEKVPYAELTSSSPSDECDTHYHCISLSYKGDRLCMIIIAPKEKDGLAQIEKDVKKYTPESLLQKMEVKNKVRIRMPRFKIESTLDLVLDLEDLGMESLFNDSADLSGIDPTGNIFVSEVIQKAFIEVNEKGTEAAAATGVIVKAKSGTRENPPIIFDADRPFIYQIVDKHSNFVLFAGKCTNPSVECN